MSAAQPPADDKAKSERNFVADQQNWEQRVKSELESATKWNDNWGELFKGDVPHDYEGRIKHLEEQLKSQKPSNGKQTMLRDGRGYEEASQTDHRRKRMDGILP